MMDADLFQKQQKLRRKFYGVRPSFAPHVLFFVILATTYYLLPTTYYAFASPPPTPGFGSGAVSTNAAGNLGVGTPTPLPETKLLIVASSSADAANYTLKILYPNSSPILVVRNDGSVGIGTASPGYQLDVNGTIHGNFNGTVNAGYVTPAVFNSLEADSGVPYGFPHSVFVSSALGVTTSSASNLPQALSVYGGGYFSGSVGIGTPSPQNTLDVFGAFRLRDMAGSNNGYVFAPASDNSVLTIGYQNPSSWYSQIMTLAYGGNVGIGTASPATTLHVVNGSKFAKFDLTSNGTDALLQLGPAAVANWARIGSNGSPMAFLTQGSDSSGASPALFINNNGNVGIGNTAPVAKLDIQSGSTSTLRLDNTNGSNVDWIKFTTSNGAFTYADLTSQSYGLNLALGTGMGGGPYFSITNGNVGIGTTTPAYPLVVAGVGSFTSAVNSSWVGSVTGNNSNATTNGILGGQVSGSYWTGVAGQSAAGNGVGVYGLATNSGGYGGYFTNSGGGYALYVNGTANATQYCISGANCITAWPSGGVTSVFGRTGAVVAASGDYGVAQVTGAAPLASPTFTGNVTMPGTGIWNSSGNVGIGNTAPTQKLTVTGGGLFTSGIGVGAAAPANYQFYAYSNTAGTGSGLEMYSDFSNPTYSFLYNTGDYGTQFEQNRDPNTGTFYGTAATTNADAVLLDVGDVNQGAMLMVGNYPSAAESNKLVIDYAGNVGIGGSMPNTGTATTTGAAIQVLANGNVIIPGTLKVTGGTPIYFCPQYMTYIRYYNSSCANTTPCSGALETYSTCWDVTNSSQCTGNFYTCTLVGHMEQ